MAKSKIADNFKELIELSWINLKVSIKNIIEYCKVVTRYYRNFSFAKADIALTLMYIFDNPYSISKRFLMRRNAENIYAYGETPLTTLQVIAEECQIQSNDHLYGLGCGRGRSAIWFYYFIGCRVTGIEQIHEFNVRAKRVAKKFEIDKVNFVEGDFFEYPLSEATVLYLYGSTLSDAEIEKFINKCSELRTGTKIITVSYPLTAYPNSSDLTLMKRFTATYTWGDADVYLHIKK